MKLLVTGGAGYIGSIVVERLLEQGHDVVVIDNLQEGHKKAVPEKAVFHEGDFGNPELLRNIFRNYKIDAVLHFAAETTIEYSMSDPARYFDNNVVKGITLLNVMRDFGCMKMIFSSTAAIFGEPEYIPIDEEHPKKPINAYGESKLVFEKVLDWYHRAYGLKFNSFRYFNAAGATEQLGEDHRNETHLIPLVLKKAMEVMGLRKDSGNSLKVFGNDYPTRDGTCVRDYIHVVDLAEAHILGLDNLEKRPCHKYNLGNGEGFTVLEVIETAKEVTGVDIPYEFAPRRPGDPAVLVASSKKAEDELGWKPKYRDLKTIIESAWKWHKTHPWGYGD